MSDHPVQKALGVPPDADPLAVLGLTPERCEVGHVEVAQRQRLKRIDEHDDLTSAEADHVRNLVRKCARQLKDPWQKQAILASRQSDQPRPSRSAKSRSESAPVRPAVFSKSSAENEPSGEAPATTPRGPGPLTPTTDDRLTESSWPAFSGDGKSSRKARGGSASHARRLRTPRPTIQLTPFDRQVLATLVAAGGWNHDSRARLTGLASVYGVTVQGLIKVVRGLSDYARSGGDRLDVAQITGGRDRMDLPQSLAHPSSEPAPAVPEWVDRLTPDLSAPSLRQTVTLSAVFGLITIVLGAVLAYMVVPAVAPDESVVERPATTTRPDMGRYTLAVPGVEDEEAGESTSQFRRETAQFDQPPTLQGASEPPGAMALLPAASQWPDDIRRIGRRLALTDDASEAVFREWEQLVDDIGRTWVLMDDEVLEKVNRAVDEMFFEASGSTSSVQRLLDEFTTRIDRRPEPEIAWRGAWAAGTLGRLANHRLLSPATVDRADRAAREMTKTVPVIADDPMADHARAWLNRLAIDRLVNRTSYDEALDDHWELWLAAQRRLGEGDGLDRSIMQAVIAMMRQPPSLTPGDGRVPVMGRLLASANFRNSRSVHAAFERMFVDEDDITETDLWILTSLLATTDIAPWFEREYIVAYGGDFAERRRRWDDIDRAWSPYLPDEVRGRDERVVVDGDGMTRWRDLFERLKNESTSHENDKRMLHYVAAARLSEAAERLRNQEPTAAKRIVEETSQLLDEGTGAVLPSFEVGTVGGRSDGVWAEQFLEADNDEQVEMLSTLDAEGDLGPRDANLLVQQIYRPRSQEHHEAARRLVTGPFRNGPNVAQAMVDQFTTRTPADRLGRVVTDLTDRELPAPGSPPWAMEARLALLRHAIELRDKGPHLAVDELARRLSETFQEQHTIRRGRQAAGAADESPHHAAARLTDLWRGDARRLARHAVDRPVPDELPAIERRHETRLQLARGPIEHCVAHRLAVLEFMAFATAAAHPRFASQVEEVLHNSTSRRTETDHVLHQAMEIEMTIARLWSIRMIHPDERERDDLWLNR